MKNTQNHQDDTADDYYFEFAIQKTVTLISLRQILETLNIAQNLNLIPPLPEDWWRSVRENHVVSNMDTDSDEVYILTNLMRCFADLTSNALHKPLNEAVYAISTIDELASNLTTFSPERIKNCFDLFISRFPEYKIYFERFFPEETKPFSIAMDKASDCKR